MSVVTGTVLAAGAVAAVLVVTNSRARDTDSPPLIAIATGTTEIRRVDVLERRHVTGTLGYSGTYKVIAPGAGLVTWLPAVGQVVSRGQSIHEVDGIRTIFLYGGRPAWRTFELGMTNGADVQQLETNLKALGHGAGLTVDRHFSVATYYAVRRWQKAANRPVTGSIPLGEVVFMPNAIRVSEHDLGLGAQVMPGAQVLHGTSNQPAITIELSPQQLPTAKKGDAVTVTLPDGKTRSGRITSIGAVAGSSSGSSDSSSPNGGDSSDSTATVPVIVRVDQEITGFLDQAQVQVAITVEAHKGVLAVPITALRAMPDGQYEVVVVDGQATRRVPVNTGLFDETAGLVEVSGEGLAEGQNVQVPSDDA
jgi:multidrug efflux pump subunit AcrA (membrane-fusion protein)